MKPGKERQKELKGERKRNSFNELSLSSRRSKETRVKIKESVAKLGEKRGICYY